MNLIFMLVLAANASTFEAVRASSGEQGRMVMTAAQFNQWISEFKAARAKAAACVTVGADKLPGLIGTERDEKIDTAAKALYQPPFIFFAGRVAADVDYMYGPLGHAYERKGCGLWSHMSELSALKRQVEAHAEAVMTSYWRAQQNGRNFAAYTPENRKAWLGGGFMDDMRNAVKAAVDAGELDVVREGLASPSMLYVHWNILAVAHLKDLRFSADVEKHLAAEEASIRAAAVYYFMTAKEPRVMDKIAALADGPHVMTRRLVAQYLGAVKAAKHKAVLEKFKADPDEWVRKTAEESLASLQ